MDKLDWKPIACGYAYGVTSVIVGQPFDTIKTTMQVPSTPSSSAAKGVASIHDPSMFEIGAKIFKSEGISGLYRGGLSLVIGGGLIRAAQFGVNHNALVLIRKYSGGPLDPKDRMFGFLDQQVALAGFCGGIGRGLVESPFEYIKVRRQVHEPWKFSEIYHGSGTTIARNSLLFGSFVIYIDISKQVFPSPDGIKPAGFSPFWAGAICANCAWLTIWPLDVVKSQLQSGNFRDKGLVYLLKDLFVTGKMFRGVVPGLMRSTISNGCAMVVYKKCEAYLNEKTI